MAETVTTTQPNTTVVSSVSSTTVVHEATQERIVVPSELVRILVVGTQGPEGAQGIQGIQGEVGSPGATLHAELTDTGTDGHPASVIAYTPIDGSRWTDPDPTTVQGALDAIASGLTGDIYVNTTGDTMTGTLLNTQGATTNVGYASKVTGDAVNRFQVTQDGTISWGDGTDAADTNLYRSAADTLHTDDNFVVDDVLRTWSGDPVPSGWTNRPSIKLTTDESATAIGGWLVKADRYGGAVVGYDESTGRYVSIRTDLGVTVSGGVGNSPLVYVTDTQTGFWSKVWAGRVVVNQNTTGDSDADSVFTAQTSAKRPLTLEMKATASVAPLRIQNSAGTAILSVDTTGVTTGAAGVGSNDFVVKSQLDGVAATAASTYLPLAGGTMSGPVDSMTKLAVNASAWSTVEKLRVNTPTTVDNAANVILSASAATAKPLVLQGIASQSASVFDVQTSAGTSKFDINLGAAISSGLPIIINGAGNGLTASSSTSYVTVGATPALAGLVRLDNAGLIAWRNAGNTANLTLGINASDELASTAPLHVTAAAINYVDRSSNDNLPATLYWRKSRGTTASPTDIGASDYLGEFPAQGYKNGAWRTAADLVFQAETVQTSSVSSIVSFWTTNTNGSFAERARVNTKGTFQIASTTGTAATGANELLRVKTPTTVDNAANVILSASATTSKPLVLQGIASQSANRFEIQNSAGTVHFSVTSSNTVSCGDIQPQAGSKITFSSGANVGTIGIPNTGSINWRNAANSGNVLGIMVNASNQIELQSDTLLTDAKNIVFGTTTGTKIGTATTQKLGFWNATPIVQPSGWAVPTGTLARTTYDADTATLSEVAQRLGALITDIYSTGLIGA